MTFNRKQLDASWLRRSVLHFEPRPSEFLVNDKRPGVEVKCRENAHDDLLTFIVSKMYEKNVRIALQSYIQGSEKKYVQIFLQDLNQIVHSKAAQQCRKDGPHMNWCSCFLPSFSMAYCTNSYEDHLFDIVELTFYEVFGSSPAKKIAHTIFQSPEWSFEVRFSLSSASS